MSENRSKSALSNLGEVGRAPAFYNEESPSRYRNQYFDMDPMPGSKPPTSKINEEDNPSDLSSPEDDQNGDGASENNKWSQIFTRCLYQLKPIFDDTAEFLEECMSEMSNSLNSMNENAYEMRLYKSELVKHVGNFSGCVMELNSTLAVISSANEVPDDDNENIGNDTSFGEENPTSNNVEDNTSHNAGDTTSFGGGDNSDYNTENGFGSPRYSYGDSTGYDIGDLTGSDEENGFDVGDDCSFPE